MRERIRKFLTVTLALVFLVSTGLMLRQAFQDKASENTYEAARQAAEAPRPTLPPQTQIPTEPTAPKETVWVPAPVEGDAYMEELAALDLDALRETNPDVVGWIRIPGTQLDYPFLQGEDNKFYLNHGWDKKYREAGSIYLESENDPQMTDFNTILYGHNMNAGTMFGSLRKYSKQSHFEEHPYVYLLTDQGVWRYEIFAAYLAPIDSAAYGLSFRQRETREEFLALAQESSVLETDIRPNLTDRILTLSTCSVAGYKTRWVVQARLEMTVTEAE